jgi:hypothetical protein
VLAHAIALVNHIVPTRGPARFPASGRASGENNVNFVLMTALLVVGLLVAMLVAAEIGRRLGRREAANHAGNLAKGTGPAEAAVFALLGLMLAFTFSGAASRFEARRHLITEEANAIGTAYLRVDLLPEDARPGIQALFHRYLDVREATYRNVEDQAATAARLAEGNELQREIWKRCVAAALRPGAPPQAAIVLLPALNAMIDITATRVMASRNHPPLIAYLLLSGLALVGALFVGYGTSINERRNWLHNLLFTAILALTIYVIVDLEFPRFGLIRVDSADVAFDELRDSLR